MGNFAPYTNDFFVDFGFQRGSIKKIDYDVTDGEKIG